MQLRHLASEAQNAYLRSDYHNCAVCIYKSHEILLLLDDDDDDNCNNSNSKNKNKNKEVFRERVGANALQQLEHTVCYHLPSVYSRGLSCIFNFEGFEGRSQF